MCEKFVRRFLCRIDPTDITSECFREGRPGRDLLLSLGLPMTEEALLTDLLSGANNDAVDSSM